MGVLSLCLVCVCQFQWQLGLFCRICFPIRANLWGSLIRVFPIRTLTLLLEWLRYEFLDAVGLQSWLLTLLLFGWLFCQFPIVQFLHPLYLRVLLRRFMLARGCRIKWLITESPLCLDVLDVVFAPLLLLVFEFHLAIDGYLKLIGHLLECIKVSVKSTQLMLWHLQTLHVWFHLLLS